MEARIFLSFITSRLQRRTTSDIPNDGFPYRPLAIQSIALLFLRPQDREQADAPRTDPAFAPVGASRFPRFVFLVELSQVFQRYPWLKLFLADF